MTTELWVLIITQVPMTFGILGSLYVTWKALNKTQKLDIRLEEVHRATNSMKDELVEATRVAALAAGVIKGIREEKTRQRTGGKK